MKKELKDVKEVKTNAQRIEELKVQREQAKEMFVKLSGAIEVLEMIESEN